MGFIAGSSESKEKTVGPLKYPKNLNKKLAMKKSS
jgi:hypothetical protein